MDLLPKRQVSLIIDKLGRLRIVEGRQTVLVSQLRLKCANIVRKASKIGGSIPQVFVTLPAIARLYNGLETVGS